MSRSGVIVEGGCPECTGDLLFEYPAHPFVGCPYDHWHVRASELEEELEKAEMKAEMF